MSAYKVNNRFLKITHTITYLLRQFPFWKFLVKCDILFYCSASLMFLEHPFHVPPSSLNLSPLNQNNTPDDIKRYNLEVS